MLDFFCFLTSSFGIHTLCSYRSVLDIESALDIKSFRHVVYNTSSALTIKVFYVFKAVMVSY